MVYLPRGISPDLLVSQVRNTVPYLFDTANSDGNAMAQGFPPAQFIRSYEEGSPLEHFDYFKLCVSAHYVTCGTPVPTDVDNQIRRKLWPSNLPVSVAIQMANLVLESRKWDFRFVSNRHISGAVNTSWGEEVLSGHLGEWFTLSSAAYCALGNYKEPLALAKRLELFEDIADEVNRHSEIFGSLWRAKEGLASLKASASIAHNFGDLDRVMDMWELSPGDPLRLKFYKLTAQPFDAERKLRYLGRLWVAGELYKAIIAGSSMAFENHRHFALRKPRCLRQSPQLLVPTGPFFDDWGGKVATALRDEAGQPTENTKEVVEALCHGWGRLPKSVGYGRALNGILEVHPDLVLPAIEVSGSRGVVEESRQKFEARWADEALTEMEEIPSRA